MRATYASVRFDAVMTAGLLAGCVALEADIVVQGRDVQKLAPLMLALTLGVVALSRLTRWRNLVAGLLLVILFIPIKRYSLPGSLPFQLEPYRIVVAGITLLWVSSM